MGSFKEMAIEAQDALIMANEDIDADAVPTFEPTDKDFAKMQVASARLFTNELIEEIERQLERAKLYKEMITLAELKTLRDIAEDLRGVLE